MQYPTPRLLSEPLDNPDFTLEIIDQHRPDCAHESACRDLCATLNAPGFSCVACSGPYSTAQTTRVAVRDLVRRPGIKPPRQEPHGRIVALAIGGELIVMAGNVRLAWLVAQGETHVDAFLVELAPCPLCDGKVDCLTSSGGCIQRGLRWSVGATGDLSFSTLWRVDGRGGDATIASAVAVRCWAYLAGGGRPRDGWPSESLWTPRDAPRGLGHALTTMPVEPWPGSTVGAIGASTAREVASGAVAAPEPSPAPLLPRAPLGTLPPWVGYIGW